jgi:pyridoxamine 5'-phosphate oxidase-like protein
MTWGELEAAAPELAQAAKARLEATRLALLGTIRADGSPQISPIEPYFTRDELLLGAMTRSLKVRDLERDPRCVLHSPVSHPDAGEPEFKLYGTVVEASDRKARSDAWWMSRPTEAARVFALRIHEAAAVAWNLEHGEMTVTRWSRRGGLEEAKRSYP